MPVYNQLKKDSDLKAMKLLMRVSAGLKEEPNIKLYF